MIEKYYIYTTYHLSRLFHLLLFASFPFSFSSAYTNSYSQFSCCYQTPASFQPPTFQTSPPKQDQKKSGPGVMLHLSNGFLVVKVRGKRETKFKIWKITGAGVGLCVMRQLLPTPSTPPPKDKEYLCIY